MARDLVKDMREFYEYLIKCPVSSPSQALFITLLIMQYESGEKWLVTSNLRLWSGLCLPPKKLLVLITELVDDGLIKYKQKGKYSGAYKITLVRAQRWLNKRHHIPLKLRREIFERDNYTCQYCGATEDSLHIDHIIPVIQGGKNGFENLVTAYASCNLKKHAKTPSEAGMELIEWR